MYIERTSTLEDQELAVDVVASILSPLISSMMVAAIFEPVCLV